MSKIDSVKCPKCNSSTWIYTAKTEKKDYESFCCVQCSYKFKIGKCKVCSVNNWTRINFEKHSRNPIVKFQCNQCKRIITVLIDHVKIVD